MLPDDCTTLTQGCGAGLFCDPLSKRCQAGCRLAADCPSGATCAQGTCRCPAGQHACGQACVPDDSTASCGARCSACPRPDNATATCASATCGFSCAPGSRADALGCVDVDECLVGNGGCSANATCVNVPGSRSCACNAGFTGDGRSCTDLDECASSNGGCDANATCTNTSGSRTCTCRQGFSGSGTTCADVNECVTNNGGCSVNATCANTPGSRTCTCNAGFSGNGFSCTPTGMGGGAGGGGAAGGTGGGGTVSQQLAAVRAAIDQNVDFIMQRHQVQGAVVTALRPPVSGASVNDPVGFFVQGSQAGPALFIGVDPATLPGLAVGDLFSFTVESGAPLNGLRSVWSVTGATRATTTPNPIPALVAPVSATDFTLVSKVDEFESRLVSLTGTVNAEPVGSGPGFKAVTLGTAGTSASSGALRLRMPANELDALRLGAGCMVQLGAVPLWRVNGTAFPSPSVASEVQVLSCPGPSVVTAGSVSTSTTVVSFNRDLQASSVSAAGFTLETTAGSPVQVVGATLTSPRVVSLNTAPQTPGVTYRVRAGPSVLSVRGNPVEPTANSATFTAVALNSCVPQVVISQVFPQNGTVWSQDYVELHNRGPAVATLTGWSLQYQSATGSNWNVTPLNAVLQPGAYFLVALGSASATGATLPFDATGNLNLSAVGGKLALVNNSTALSGCGAGSRVDLVSWGNNPSMCAEGSSARVPSTGEVLSRPDTACVDTNDNAADFSPRVVSPRNSASPPVICACP